ncbi:MAG TPA: C2 family cysteine protease, partial [Pirellulaceae bacterium]
FNDLKDLTSTNLTLWAGYRSLAKKVVHGDRANQWNQGGTLGNLTAGSTGVRLNNLVNKWFLGLDRPQAAAGTTYRYVNGSLFQGIQYQDIDQEGAADCYFLAPLAEVAQQSPNTILNMFTDNGDGTFMVRFFRGGTSEYVTVDRFLPVESNGTSRYAGFGGTYTQSTNELWVALAEKAYAQINESNWIGQDGTNSYAGIDFGSMSKAMGHITGRSTTSVPVVGGLFGLLMRSQVISQNGQGKAITFSSFDSDDDVDDNIVANHVYTLAGYDAATQRFRLFNPWGFNNNKPGEVFLTWSQIASNFSTWAYTAV